MTSIWTLRLAVVSTVAATIALLYWRNDTLYDKWKAEEVLRTQYSAALDQVEESHDKAQEISETYQNQLADLTKQRDAIRMRLKSKPACYPVTDTTSRPLSASAGLVVPNGNGLRVEWLYDFAERCEQVRLKANGLQSFFE